MAIKNKKQFKSFIQRGLSALRAQTLQAGVTLIELIVVVAIFSVVSSVLIFNYSDFSTNVSVRNLSQEVALTIRKAQTYATSVRGIDNVGLNTRTYPAYGISFSLDVTSSDFEPNSKQFILFADIPPSSSDAPNKKYESLGNCGTPALGDECLENFSISSADTIVEICSDAVPGGCVSTGSIDITFRRPLPDAIICYKATQDGSCINSSASYVDIVIRSAKGLSRTVGIWNTGQINVK